MLQDNVGDGERLRIGPTQFLFSQECFLFTQWLPMGMVGTLFVG